MKLIFLGTRGGIIARSSKHYMHSSLLIYYYSKRIMIDCGKDWLDKVFDIKPDAIFLTHSHDDHVGGLANGVPCDVYATEVTFSKISHYPIENKSLIIPKKVVEVGRIKVTAYQVEHSINAPAVGYKISTGKSSIFYVPDLISINDQKAALKGIKCYIGDGAIITRKHLMKKKDSKIIGHVPILEQLKWCKKFGIEQMIITHCGSEITKGDPDVIQKKILELEYKYEVKIRIAFDGMEVSI